MDVLKSFYIPKMREEEKILQNLLEFPLFVVFRII